MAKKLKAQKEELANIFEGNPKRSTPNPTAKRLLKQFQGVSIVILNKVEHLLEILITDLKQIQLKIIHLLDFEPGIYLKLPEQLKLFFLR